MRLLTLLVISVLCVAIAYKLLMLPIRFGDSDEVGACQTEEAAWLTRFQDMESFPFCDTCWIVKCSCFDRIADSWVFCYSLTNEDDAIRYCPYKLNLESE
jgi:hypothetical protein